LFSWCKKCKKESDKKYQQKNREAIKEQRRLFRQNNKETIKLKNKKYRNKMVNRLWDEIVVPKAKKCTGCGKIKTDSEFYKNKMVKDGLTIFCKECCKVKNTRNYDKYIDRRKEYGKRYTKKNKPQIMLQKIKYYQNNKEKIQQYKKRWQQENSEKIAIRQKSYRENHLEERRDYERNRKSNDLNYRMLNNLRGRLYYAVKSQGIKKMDKTMNLMGCSMRELKTYIESLFPPGMNFDNYGKGDNKWSIDHIRPCSSFDLSDLEQQRACFHYSNLRPLWNRDNFRKNSLYNGKYIRKNRGVK
jgi:hypothetical protein